MGNVIVNEEYLYKEVVLELRSRNRNYKNSDSESEKLIRSIEPKPEIEGLKRSARTRTARIELNDYEVSLEI